MNVKCKYCGISRRTFFVLKHEESCALNPKHLKLCPVCENPIKNKGNATCSTSCANTLFRTGENNPNWKESNYITTCFLYHEKKCVVCEERKIVAVHHYDEDRTNNRPENLIPLCPTHHQYFHSRYRDEVEYIIEEYRKKFIGD